MDANGKSKMDTSTRFLVVDDMVAMRRIIRNLLKELGFEHVDEAEDGEKGLDKLRGGQFGFVISDWNMPVMDGLTVVRAVRSAGTFPELRIMMITTEAQAHSVALALESGADEYLMKPFTREAVLEKLALLGLAPA